MHWFEFAFHIVLWLDYQLDAVNEELVEKVLADIAFFLRTCIDKHQERLYLQRITVVIISGSNSIGNCCILLL